MAKQTGIHQINGKVGELSYYRQTGISSGLIRRINQTLSERVKTSPEYANTRLNNVEFKIAMQAAGSLFQGIQPILRPTRTLFRTSRCAAYLYDILMRGTDPWGVRLFRTGDRQAMCDAVNRFGKRQLLDLCNINFYSYDEQNLLEDVEIDVSRDISAYMDAMRADGIIFKVYQMQFYETWSPVMPEYVGDNFTIIQTPVELEYDFKNTPDNLNLEGSFISRGQIPTSVLGYTFFAFFVVVALPYRDNGSQRQTLQGECTFRMYIDPEHQSVVPPQE